MRLSFFFIARNRNLGNIAWHLLWFLYHINHKLWRFRPPFLSARREILEPSSRLASLATTRHLFFFIYNTRLRDSWKCENSCAIELAVGATAFKRLPLARNKRSYLVNKFRSSQWARESIEKWDVSQNTFTCAKDCIQLDELNVKIRKPPRIFRRITLKI